ncbi:hypothetical protein [Lysobacter sp. A03]|uniref:hypothetical protein n=1 Tax=Lysobacter sp. A03 TaxID=1199154 RepID=UPI0005B6F47E|nr:hypothetical protein [Lysobacter sp. A03]KIQ96483.1 hypothetical protein TI01_1932 [Lysobacter sp. A03]
MWDQDNSCAAPCATCADDDEGDLVARLYELSQDSAADDAELEALDAIVYQRLLQTYGDEATEPSEA